jgi:hypothetical protein
LHRSSILAVFRSFVLNVLELWDLKLTFESPFSNKYKVRSIRSNNWQVRDKNLQVFQEGQDLLTDVEVGFKLPESKEGRKKE